MSSGLQLTLFSPQQPNNSPIGDFFEIPDNDTIGIDVETCDPELASRGPGGVRGDGFVAGISIYSKILNKSSYYPIRHLGGGNLSEGDVVTHLRATLRKSGITIVGANLLYDIEWLSTLGIEVPKERWRDVQLAHGLIDEEADSYSLNALGKLYVGEGKNEDLLRQAAAAFGIDPKKDLWKLDAKYVAEYAAMDAWLPVQIYEKQKPKLEAEELTRVYYLECSLMPVIWEMRRKGVRIDEDKAARLSINFMKQYKGLLLEISRACGHPIDVWSNKSLAYALDKRGVQYPRTLKGNPSFTADWLSANEDRDELLGMIVMARSIDRCNTFVQSTILGNCHKGRIHAHFVQMKSDDEEGGTRTGRLACADPNLQQIPSRNKELAPLIRGCFVPDEGKLWAKLDYSQQEPRILTHLAAVLGLEGAGEMRDEYKNDPKADFYTFITNRAGISRRQAKDLTLGRFYGMGIMKMAMKLGCSEKEASAILAEFDASVPFVKRIAEYADMRAQTRGYVKTLCGRRRHFNLWTSRHDFKAPAMSYEMALKAYSESGIRRADTRKALNAVIQGSAADMVKQAMVDISTKLGYTPMMTVHDELNFSVDNMEQANEIKFAMENALQLSLPIKADLTLGESWK